VKGSRLIFRTEINCFIDGVTQEVMPAGIDNAQSNGVGSVDRQIRLHETEAGQVAETSRRKEQIPDCQEKLLREIDFDRTVNRHR
jgi:hypothetical protein